MEVVWLLKFASISIYNNEASFNLRNRYSCHENIEIHNIPESILQKDLEEYVIIVGVDFNVSSIP